MQICADVFLVVRMSGCPCRLFVDRTSYDTPAGRLDEIEDQIPFLARLVLGLDRFQRLRIIQASGIQRAIDVLNQEYLLIRESPAT